jgi:phage baseplate assembly protein W
MRNTRFLGLQYPLVRTPRGILAQKSGIDQIKADMLQLLLTNPGERVMLPTFGTPLRKLMFEPNDPTLEIEARNMIVAALVQWEKRVEIQNVTVSCVANEDDLDPNDPNDDNEHILSIKILFYDPQNIQKVEELAVALPYNGG